MNGFMRAFGVLTLSFLSICASDAFSQDDEVKPTPPKAAGQSVPVLPQTIDNQNGQQASDQDDALEPDTRPLTGIQTLTLGSQQLRHSYWVPGFQYGNTIQSITLASGQRINGWSSDNYLAGNLSLLSTSSHSQLAVNYSGGGFLSTNQVLGNGYYHELGITQGFNWGRLSLALLDQFSYVPEAIFGFGGAIRLGVPGVNGNLAPSSPDLVSNFVPNQSILASTGTRYSNASAIQLTYSLSPRSSLTMAGSYGFLDFIQPGNIDSIQDGANIGFDYQLSSKDSIGMLYRFTTFQYGSFPQAIQTHIASLAYGRKITARLGLQLTAGPELAYYRVPFNGTSSQVLPSVTMSLVYGLPRGQLSANYSQGVAGGSGLLLGSSANQLTFAGTHRLGRVWTAMGSLGYSRNRSLGPSSATSADFGSWVVTTGLLYPFSPRATMSFGYTALIQTSSTGCVGPCTTNYSQHQISLGFQWNTRPFVIR